MGMDVCGLEPDSRVGKYFGSKWWYWNPLVTYIKKVAPEIAEHCKAWRTNDGDGLDANLSKQLATKLKRELESGRTHQYEVDYNRAVDALPDEPCDNCGGTGQRKTPAEAWPESESCSECLGTGKNLNRTPEALHAIRCDNCGGTGQRKTPAEPWTGACYPCRGTGKCRPMEAGEIFEAENVAEFAEFLEHCGGFRIW